MEILRVEDLVKTYGKGENQVNAVDHISFSIEKGEFVAIVGASGSGKSTLLHLLGGVDRPTSGKVFIDGKDIYSLNDDNLAIFRRRQIGLIYQFYNLIPILNVRENITLPCDLDGQKVDEKRLDELIKTLGLEKREKHLPNQLSGGQQQRVSIGRAMINNPALMLADEPTGNLDSKASDEIISLLKLSNKKFNQTVVIITHDLEIAKEAGDKLFVHILSYYKKDNSKLMSRFIARMLHRKKHIKIVRILTKKLQKAASIYPVRSFGIENDIQIQKCLEKAKQKKQELKEKGIKADIIREEPFVEAQDSVQYKIYLMKWKQQRGNYTAEIEEITI